MPPNRDIQIIAKLADQITTKQTQSEISVETRQLTEEWATMYNQRSIASWRNNWLEIN